MKDDEHRRATQPWAARMSGLATLPHEVRHEAEVRRSRFLAIAAPADSPEAAQALLQQVATADASHNCWAYRIGDQYRFNDDGEPGGTAGRPILAAIEGQGFDQVMVVVTRWFGGTRLGAGGLVRAYGGTAAECLRVAPRQPLLRWHEAEVEGEFALEAPLRTLLAELGGEAGAASYGGRGMTLPLRVPEAQADALHRRVADLSRGRARVRSG